MSKSKLSKSIYLYKTKKILRELKKKKGRGTELISLYIPKGRSIYDVAASLREEYGTASNIKSTTTRKNVQDALTKVMQRLKMYKTTPENGLVIFCGALPPYEDAPLGSEVIQLYEIEPLKPLEVSLYRCDDHFHTEPLEAMLQEEKVIGIISLDSTEAGFGIISGSRFEVVEVETSGVSGKTKKGGQSARRYERLREMELTHYFNRVGKKAKEIFIDIYRVQGLIVAGPGPTKEDFVNGGYLDYRLQNSLLATLDSSYAGAEGVREAFNKAEGFLKDVRVMEERKLIQRFLREITSSGLALYGIKEVLNSIKNESADTVLVLEDLNLIMLKKVCKDCNEIQEKVVNKEEYISAKQELVSKPCSCDSQNFQIEEYDVVDYLSDLALDHNVNLEVISSKTEDSLMLRSFGGIAALLRYKVN
ncbi:MAG: peptide chain release factor aRF-1 [Nitrososphaerales archaeon]